MNLPPYDKMKVRMSKSEKPLVFDILRRRYITLTPEEMVRQFFINYLIEYRGYPASLLANEVEMKVGEKKLRCDSILYDLEMRPRMILEYKAPDIPLTEKVLNQVIAYNTQLNVPYLMMSNGTQHICLRYDEEVSRWKILEEIPRYEDLKPLTPNL